MCAPRTAQRGFGPRFVTAAAVVAGAAILATACGTAPAAGAHGKPTGVTVAQAHRVPPADSRAGATAYARRLLASLRLPSARKLRWPARPPAGLSPTRPGILSDFVDV